MYESLWRNKWLTVDCTTLYDIVTWCALSVMPILLFTWCIDHRLMQRSIDEAECMFELIDPVRAETQMPLSDKCKEILKRKFLDMPVPIKTPSKPSKNYDKGF